MKILISLLLGAFLIISCKKDKNSEITDCGVHDPLTELDWLAELTELCDEDPICRISINQGIYDGTTVFYSVLSGPLCDAVYSLVLLNCNGEVVKEYTLENHDDFAEEVESVEMIFSCWE